MKSRFILAAFVTALMLGGCAGEPRKIIVDKDFVKKILVNGGMIAGDGMYSVPLPDGRSLFLLGDSFRGEIAQDGSFPPSHMYRNSYVFYDPASGTSESYIEANGPLTSAAVPLGVTDEAAEWYWPGGGIVIGDKLYIFQTDLFQREPGMWGFASRRVDLLEYEYPSMKILRQERVRKNCNDSLMFGATVCTDNEYIYIYAPGHTDVNGKQMNQAFVARSHEEDLFGEWEYLSKDGWSKDPSAMVPMEGTSCVEVSSQFNVFKLRDKYVLLTEQANLFEGFIYTFVSDTPYGPWTNAKRIYDIPQLPREDLFAYNAMAHPEIQKDNMILVSYDVNSFDLNLVFPDASSYQPVFLWVPVEMILE